MPCLFPMDFFLFNDCQSCFKGFCFMYTEMVQWADPGVQRGVGAFTSAYVCVFLLLRRCPFDYRCMHVAPWSPTPRTRTNRIHQQIPLVAGCIKIYQTIGNQQHSCVAPGTYTDLSHRRPWLHLPFKHISRYPRIVRHSFSNPAIC